MQESIVTKLKSILNEGINNECKVVYLLAECRKLLEKYPSDPTPFALKLYCHWALHIDLYHPKVTLPFLQRVDAYAESVLAGTTDFLGEHRMLREFVFLDTFRQQLKDLLKTYGLPTEVCDKNDYWQEFLKHYAGVIEDGSLSCNANGQPLKLVKEVIFTKGKSVPNQGFYIPFGLAWTIVLLNGKKLTVEVNASAPNGNEMIGSKITLF